MKQIFPFSPFYCETWKNWSNYLFITEYRIYSLQDYLNFFNANFKIVNDQIRYINSNSLQDEVDQTTENFKEDFGLEVLITNDDDDDTIVVDDIIIKIFAPSFSWRQGLLSTQENLYISFSNKVEEKITTNNEQIKTLTKKALQDLINNGDLVKLERGKTIFRSKREEQEKNWFIDEKTDRSQDFRSFNLNDFLIVSKPISSLYLIKSSNNTMIFNYKENGHEAVGEQLLFTLEFLPQRYYFQNNYDKWGQITEFQGGGWYELKNTSGFEIVNQHGQPWTGGYPLIHVVIQRSDTGIVEEVIFDSINWVDEDSMKYTKTPVYKIKSMGAPIDFLKECEVLIR